MAQDLEDSNGERGEGSPAAVTLPPEEDPILPLVRQIQEGRDVDKAFEEIHRRFYRTVVAFFVNLGFVSEDAEDLTQQTFTRVFTGMGGFRGESKFARWLFEIAGNLYKNELRKRHSEKRKALVVSFDGGAEKDDSQERGGFEPVDPGPGADQVLEDSERLALLRAAFGELPPQMRQVCHLRFVEERKYREIAILLKISIETVKAHLHQARKRLIAKLGEDFTGGRDLSEGQGSES